MNDSDKELVDVPNYGPICNGTAFMGMRQTVDKTVIDGNGWARGKFVRLSDFQALCSRFTAVCSELEALTAKGETLCANLGAEMIAHAETKKALEALKRGSLTEVEIEALAYTMEHAQIVNLPDIKSALEAKAKEQP